VGRVEGEEGWRERVGGLMMPVDTANQVVCTVGQKMATAALTIPRGEQTLSGTVWDYRPSY